MRAAGARFLVRTDAVHRRVAIPPDRARGDLRTGAVHPDVPHAGGSGREGEQHPVRAERRHLDREGLADPLDGRTDACRRRLGQHLQPVRPVLAVRWLQGERLRSRGRPARSGAVRPAGAGVVSSDRRLPVRRTAKLYVGGQFPRSESGRTFEVWSGDGRLLAHAARASRKDLRDAVVAAPRAPGGWAPRTPYNRGPGLYRVARTMEGRRGHSRRSRWPKRSPPPTSPAG